MPEKVYTRTREPEPQIGYYDELFNTYKQRRDQAAAGAVVLRAKDTPWEQSRQGLIRWFSHMRNWSKLAAPDWMIFEQDIRRHSGKHRHQGGLAIFVLEGKGYTVVDGVRHDWEKGDLILLPVKAGGCEHQHFNAVEGQSCHWAAFVFVPHDNHTGNELEQRELSPDWKKG